MRRYSVLFILLSFTLATLRAQTSEVLDSYGLPHPSQAKAMRFWLDDNVEGMQQAIEPDGDYQLDVSSLPDGLHILHCQVVDDNDRLTPIRSSFFVKITPVNGSGPVIGKKLIYWFDDETTTSYTNIEKGGQLLDASSLTEGLHTFHYQVLCNNGQMTPVMSAMFLNLHLNSNTTTAQSFQYWFDDDVSTLKQSDVFGSVQKIDAAFLSAGLHSINLQLIENDGKVGAPLTRMFFKDIEKQVPDSCNGITKYRYWVNDNLASIKTVTLKDTVKSYTLIDLLPVSKEPIRSSLFHFEVSDNTPIVYAKNVFHIRFHDAQGYFIDEDKTYIDYNVSQSVDDVTLIESGVSVIAEKPAANTIKWYKLDAERGDSLQFKLDRAATIQLFSPTGKEVYHVYGAESVKWGGLHAAETGTFYLALHDVTATYGNTVSIDYNHIDKYAVLRQDVSVVGNGGFSTITFEGNGFRDLFTVDLYTEDGDTISSSAIRHISDAIVDILFDFTDRRTGKYNAIFHFTTENKEFPNLVYVEDAKDINLALDVKCSSTFRRGTATIYTITVTNKGNATAYNVPMEIYLSAEGAFSNIESVRFKDEQGIEFNNVTLNEIDKDSIDEETLRYIENLMCEYNALYSFIVKNDSIEGGIYGFTDQLITIQPNSSTTFFMEIKSSSTVDLKVRIPSDWIVVHSQKNIAESRRGNNTFDRDWCCEKEKWECTAEITLNIAGMIPIVGCISGALDMWFYDIFEIACTDGVDLKDKIDNFCYTFSEDVEKHKSYLWRGINDLIGCVTGKIMNKIADLVKRLTPLKKARVTALANHKSSYDAFIKKQNSANYCKNQAQKAFQDGRGDLYTLWMEDYDKYMKEAEELEKLSSAYMQEWRNLGDQILELENNIDKWKKELGEIIGALKGATNAISLKSQCYQKWKKVKTNCPSNSNEDGGSSSPVKSFDPNEIYGYLAESGSNAVNAEKTDVYYTIQFENDTTFATASAHEIVVTDTLDAKKFDLSTFAPTRVKIGDKSAELTGEKNFVTTIDMRPEIYAIAQVEGTFDEQKGIAKWHITSLDPMTMEPTDDVMQGVLPVNHNGNGIGELMFDVSLKPGLTHGSEINNRAGIVFDQNDVIMTPTWTNIIDRIAPESCVADVQLLNDSTATVSIEATDELSGAWQYDVYVQYGSGAWFKAAENVPADTTASVKVYEGIDHGFYVVVTDSAGNVEQKEAAREFSLSYNAATTVTGDVNGDEAVNGGDVMAVYNSMAGGATYSRSDVNGDGAVNGGDVMAVYDIMAGGKGSVRAFYRKQRKANNIRQRHTNVKQ